MSEAVTSLGILTLIVAASSLYGLNDLNREDMAYAVGTLLICGLIGLICLVIGLGG